MGAGAEAQIAIAVPVALDHAISVNTYTTLALAAGFWPVGDWRRDCISSEAKAQRRY